MNNVDDSLVSVPKSTNFEIQQANNAEDFETFLRCIEHDITKERPEIDNEPLGKGAQAEIFSCSMASDPYQALVAKKKKLNLKQGESLDSLKQLYKEFVIGR